MRIGFSIDEKTGIISADALTGAENADQFRAELGEDILTGFLDLTECKSDSRGNLKDAFEALHSIIGVNHFHDGSLCYAFEVALEEAFRAGQAYESERWQAELAQEESDEYDLR